MAMKTSTILCVLVIMAVLLDRPRPLFGHLEPTPAAIFAYSIHPDFPLATFARGELGVLQPTYARSYLYVTYRYFIGQGFDQEEQKALVALWDERLNSRWNAGEAWIKEWLDTRSTVPGVGVPPELQAYHRFPLGHFKYPGFPPAPEVQAQYYHSLAPGYFSEYLNCPEDVFWTAVRTLNERIAQFSAASPEVREWVRAQDQVFANCSGGPAIPGPAEPGIHPLIQADRAYQIAAAHLYAGHFDVAENLFREIAQDASSPWRQIAPYLVARTLVRKATLGAGLGEAGPGETDMATLAQAEVALHTVLSDDSLHTIHPAAQRLLAFVRFRLQPIERCHELAHAILQANVGATLQQDVWDYTLLLDRFHPPETTAHLALEQGDELLATIRQDDLTDWVFTFQDTDAGALDHALHQWTATSALPWLVASLSKIGAGHPQLPELFEAAEKVPQRSPAFPSVAFHRIRLLIGAGRKEEARTKLDDLLSPGGPALPPSALNLFRAERMAVARTLDEFLTYAQRVPARVGYDPDDGRELLVDFDDQTMVNWHLSDTLRAFSGRALFDADAAAILNKHMPLSLLKAAATSRLLPVHLRRELALAVWVRAVLLEDEAVGRELVPVVENLVPELKAFLNAYLSADTSAARKFASVFLMLKFPGMRPYIFGRAISLVLVSEVSVGAMYFVSQSLGRLTPLDRIDNYRDNWWCSFEPTAERSTWNYYETRTLMSEP